MTEKNEISKMKKKESPINAFARKGEVSTIYNSITQGIYSKHLGELEPQMALDNLRNEVKKLKDGNFDYLENVLLAQAHALDAIFNNLATKASDSEWVNQFEVCLKLALKAQSQCRSTLETLAYIKNPPHVSFVKQANIGQNQQVNNFPQQDASPCAREIKNQQNQLMEGSHGQRLDIRAPIEASKVNS